MNISERVKIAARKRGMTLKDVAAKMPNVRTGEIGISKDAFISVLNSNITLSRLEELSEIIGCNIAEFFADIDVVPNSPKVVEGKGGKFAFDDVLQEKGMTKSELAERLGIARSGLTVCTAERVKLSTAQRIADAIGVPLWRMLYTEDELKAELGIE